MELINKRYEQELAPFSTKIGNECKEIFFC